MNAIKYVRGSVWQYKDPNKNSKFNRSDSVQGGDRPVIVISSDVGNATSPVVTVVPVSSQVGKDLSINVKFKTDKGADNIALCNQIFTTSTSNLQGYKYIIDGSDMNKIESGILESLGMSKYIHNYDCEYSFDQLKSVIDSLVATEVKSRCSSNLVTADYIRGIISDLIREEHERDESSNDKQKQDVDTNSSKNTSKKTRRKKKSNERNWTQEYCEDFILDFETMPRDDFMKKYNIETSKQMYQYKYYCKRKLNLKEDLNE